MQGCVFWFSVVEDLVQQLEGPRQLYLQVSPCHIVQTTGNGSRCIYSVWWLQMRQSMPQAEICKLALRTETEASQIIPRPTGRQKLKPPYFQSITSTSPHWLKWERHGPLNNLKAKGLFQDLCDSSSWSIHRTYTLLPLSAPLEITKIHAYSSWSCAWTKYCLLLSLKLQLQSAPICIKFDCFPGISPIRWAYFWAWRQGDTHLITTRCYLELESVTSKTTGVISLGS